MLLRRTGRIRLASAAVAMTALAGCGMPGFLKVSAPPDGTTVKKLSADLTFGAEPPTRANGPRVPQTPPPVPPPTFDALGLFDPFPDLPAIQVPRRPAPPTQAVNLGPCPDAGASAFPDKPVTADVHGTIEPGVYRWKENGTFDVVGLGKIALPRLTSRIIRVLPSLTPGTTAYELEQTFPLGTEIDTIEVRASGQDAPTDGIYLTRLQYITTNAHIDFAPLSVLAPKLLSLPVPQRSDAVSATSIDAQHALVLTVNGTTDGTKRERLDACGEVVEAWKFSGNRILRGLNQGDQIANSTYELYFAPQLGGLIVGDHVVMQGTVGPFTFTSDVATNIGSLKPVAQP